MSSGGFSFSPSTSASTSLAPYQAFLPPPRFVNRLREFPLDLRFRPTLTPPSTPSPPRKRSKLLNLDLKTFEAGDGVPNIPISSSHINQFSSTISIDDKKYFQNTFESLVPKALNPVKFSDNSDELIDITHSDNEMDSLRPSSARGEFRSDSNLTEDLSNHAPSESSDEIVDIESNEDSVVFSELMTSGDDGAVLESGKSFFEDPKLHSNALEGFAKLFDSSLYNLPEKSAGTSSSHRSKSERKRVKSRKQLVDEETTSPVSGTIIRKLFEGEELVVRKGDIDPVSFEDLFKFSGTFRSTLKP